MATVNPIQVQKYLSGMDYPASKQEGADETTWPPSIRNEMATSRLRRT